MTTAVARTNGNGAAPIDRELVRRTVARDATNDELELYLYDCQRRNVHPLDKLLHFTKRSGRYVPVTSIDLLRSRAADTRQFAGSDDAKFEQGAPGGPPLSATVTVYRLTQGQRYAYTASARWSEYNPGGQMWSKMPHTMLAKCAEALALRKAFPQELAGLYSGEEMAQAGEPEAIEPPKRTNPHVNRAEDFVDVPAVGDPDRLPDGNPEIKALPKKNARADFEIWQKELHATKTVAQCKDWMAGQSDRVQTYPEDWRDIARGLCTQHLAALRAKERPAPVTGADGEGGAVASIDAPPEPEGDPLDTLTDAYSACNDAAAMWHVDQKLYIPFVQSASPDDRERANDIRQQHLDRIEGATQ